MSAGYVLKEGFAGLGRAKLAAFTSMFSLFIAVLLIGVLFRIGYNAFEVTQALKQQVEVEVFLLDLNDAQTNRLQNILLEKPQVAGLSYISKDSASQVFQQEFGLGAETISQLDFLPASFRLTMSEEYQVAQIDSVVTEIRGYDGVDEVRFNLALLQTIEERTETFFGAGIAIGLFILFVAMVLVFNTIRLTIYAKRDLIKAMKLVGATNAFIRRPFLVEGVLQGILAGSFAALMIYAIFELVIPGFIPQIGVLSWPFGQWYFLIGGVILLAILMGWWGSRWAAKRFISDSRVGS
ncbi:MAG: ABC transporter permease [Balneolaceae bacterium]|nr:MAG: ABC transporter permease [Balneolaceae bacterium]